MKKLVLSVILIMLVAVPSYAHQGTIGLYVDETLSDCDANLGTGIYNLKLYYWKDQGQDLGNACEFKLVLSTPNAFFQDPTWADNVELTLGSITTGIALTGTSCLGAGQSVVYLGTIPVFNIMETDTFHVRVAGNPKAYPNPSIYVTVCNPNQTKREVLGGWFIFNGTCNVMVESKSWGAIKELYK